MTHKSMRLLKGFVVLVTVAVFSLSLYNNCNRATLGSLAGSSGALNNGASAQIGAGSCPANQVAIGVGADQLPICANTTSGSGGQCPSGSSVYSISPNGLVCVVNTAWDQTGSMCPLGQYLISYANGSIQCAGPTTLSGSPQNYQCPAGQYLNGIVNNQPVCLPLPSSVPTAFVCSTGQYLYDLNGGVADCRAAPWIGAAQASTCASGTFALGWNSGSLVCQQNVFNSPGTNFTCPSGKILLSYASGTGTCGLPPNPDISHACPNGQNPSGINPSGLICQTAGTGGGPHCPAGQFVTGLQNGSPVCSALAINHLSASCPASSYPIGTSNGSVVCVGYSNLQLPNGTSPLCVPNSQAVCSIVGGIGQKTCDANGASYSSCVAIGCFAGYMLANDTCVQTACTPGTQQNCTGTNGSGVQYCNAQGAWGTCQLNACVSGYSLVNGQCQAQSCTPGTNMNCSSGPAYGIKTCQPDGLGYGSCVFTSCQNGYTLQGQSCVDSTPPRITFVTQPANPTVGNSANLTFAVIDNESGVKSVSCLLDSQAFNPCSSPVQLQNLSNGSHTFKVTALDNSGLSSSASATWANQVCAPGSSQQCTVANGSGLAACMADGTYSTTCVATTCSAGYHLDQGACVALNCGPGYTVVGNACVDTTAPTLNFVNSPANPTIGTTAQLDFSADDKGSGIASVTCQLDQKPAVNCQSPYVMTGLGYGSHTLVVTVTDTAGNKTTRTVSWINIACSPGSVASCGISHGTGQQTCSADGSGYGACVAKSCDPGYDLANGTCSYHPKSCSLPWGGSIASGTSITAFEQATVFGASCKSENRACNDGTLSGSFASQSCLAKTCVPNSSRSCDNGGAGTGTQTCSADGSTWGSCRFTSCSEGHYLSADGDCVSGLPSGSYQASCINCAVSGNILSCDCSGWGFIPWWYGHTSIDYTKCVGDIWNYWANLVCTVPEKKSIDF